MANLHLPPIVLDSSGFHNAANLTVRGAEALGQGMLSLGEGIGGGLRAIGQKRERRQERTEARAERQAAEAESRRRFDLSRQDRMDELGLKYEIEALDDNEALLAKEMEALGGRFSEIQARAAFDENSLMEAAPEIAKIQAEYRRLAEGRLSLRQQKAAIISQRTGRQIPVVGGVTELPQIERVGQPATQLTGVDAEIARKNAQMDALKAGMGKKSPMMQKIDAARAGVLKTEIKALGEKKERLARAKSAAALAATVEQFPAHYAPILAADPTWLPRMQRGVLSGAISAEDAYRDAQRVKNELSSAAAKQAEDVVKADAAAVERQERAADLPALQEALGAVRGLPDSLRDSLINGYLTGKGERRVDFQGALQGAQAWKGATAEQRGEDAAEKAAANEAKRDVTKAKERILDIAGRQPSAWWASEGDKDGKGRTSNDEIAAWHRRLAVEAIAREPEAAELAYPHVGADVQKLIVEALGRTPEAGAPTTQASGPNRAGWEAWKEANKNASPEKRKRMAEHFARGGT